MSDDNFPSTSVKSEFFCSLCGFKFSKERFLTNHYDFCKDFTNPSDRLGPNKNAVKDVPPTKQLSNTELLVEHSTTDLTYDIKFEEIEFTETTVFGLACTESRQPIKSPKTDLLDEEFKCGKCNYATADVNQLVQHEKIHWEYKPYKCKICSTYTTTKLKYLKEHVKRHAAKKSLKCTVCKFAAVKECILAEHMTVHSGKRFQCSKCDYASPTLGNLKNHMRTHNGDKPELENTEVLDGQSTTDITYVVKVEEREFTENTIFGSDCMESPQPIDSLNVEPPEEKCNDVTAEPTQFQEHEKVLIEPKLYKCNICTKYTTTKRKYLKEHEKRHAADKPFKCTICKYSAVKKWTLAEHMSVHTGVKRFQCSKCDYASPRRRALNKHMRTHYRDEPEFENTELLDGQSTTDMTYVNKVEEREFTENTTFGSACTESPQPIDSLKTETEVTQFQEDEKVLMEPELYKCKICATYTTTKLKYLKQHEKNHAANKSFWCTVCRFAAVSRDILARHIRKHKGEKAYQCNVCGKAFLRRSTLTRHMTTHTGERRHRCTMCRYASADRATLNQHMRTHTGEKPYKCSKCGYASAWRTNFRSHMRSHNGDKPQLQNTEVLDGQSINDVTSGCTESPQPIDSLNAEAPEKKCTDVTAEATQFQEHNKVLIEPKLYKCNICTTYTTTKRRYLIDHRKIHAANKPFKCTICEYSTVKRCVLAEHMSTHTGEKRFQCSICDYASRRRGTLKTHMRTHYGDKPELENTILLDGQSTTDMIYVQKVEELEFTGNTICGSDCTESPQTVDSLNAPEEKCNGVTAEATQFPEHEKVLIEPELYKCNICTTYTTTKRKYLKDHEKRHAADKPFKCTICKYSAVNKWTLAEHMSVHTGVKRFQCSICDYASPRRSTLKTHMRTHYGDKPELENTELHAGQSTTDMTYVQKVEELEFTENTICGSDCTESPQTVDSLNTPEEKCNGVTAEATQFPEHEKVLIEPKLYKCNICTTYTTTKHKYLKEHEKRHAADKPFKCTICKYSTVNKWTLAEHTSVHTGVKRFQCSICDYASPRRSTLKKHMRTHYRDEREFENSELLDRQSTTDLTYDEKDEEREFTENSIFGSACPISPQPIDSSNAEAPDKKYNDVTAEANQLQEHEKVSMEPKVYKCNICTTYTTTSLKYLKIHEKRHAADKPFKCPLCKYSAVNKTMVGEHMRWHIGKKRYQCDVCGIAFFTVSSLTRHMSTHTGEKRFLCAVCGHATACHAMLKRHIRTHTGEEALKCSECDYASAWRTNLANHMKIHNGELKQTSLVEEHAKEELPSSITGEKSFKCSFCDYASIQRHELTVHVQRKHAKEKTFLCDQCDKAFVCRSYLLAHIKRTHRIGTRAERLFACKICEFTTKVLLKFRIHMANHTGKETFKCAVCHLVVTHRSALIIHMRSHTGEKPFKCGLCEYSTTTSSMLKSHMKQHTQEKLFKCDVCDKTFLHSCNRTEHMRSHTGEKPYQCKVCEYKCARHYALTTHMRTHTGDKPYRCSVCDYANTSSCKLKVHMKTHV